MTNTGIEFMIGWNDRVKDGVMKDFGYNVNFFITKNKNKLVKYGATTYYGATEYGNRYAISRRGWPRYQYCMLEAVGIYESDAQVEMRELNGIKIAPIRQYGAGRRHHLPRR